jgi:hypothetical protein
MTESSCTDRGAIPSRAEAEPVSTTTTAAAVATIHVKRFIVCPPVARFAPREHNAAQVGSFPYQRQVLLAAKKLFLKPGGSFLGPKNWSFLGANMS